MGAFGRNPDGTRIMLPSMLRDLELRFVLSQAEAEELFNRVDAGEDEATAAEEIKAARTVNIAATEAVSAAESHPLAVADKRREEQAHPSPKPSRSTPEPGEGVKGGSVTRAGDLP